MADWFMVAIWAHGIAFGYWMRWIRERDIRRTKGLQ